MIVGYERAHVTVGQSDQAGRLTSDGVLRGPGGRRCGERIARLQGGVLSARRPRRMHEIGDVGEHDLDAIDHAVADLEGLHEHDGVRPLQGGAVGLPIVREVRVDGIVVVEERRRQNDPALLVHEGEAALAHALVDSIQPQLELRLAPLRIRRGAKAALSGADPVLVALAIRIELSEHGAIVALDRAEIAVRHRDEALARTALRRCQRLLKSGVVPELFRVPERGRQPSLAVHEGFDLNDLAVRYADSDCEVRKLSPLANGAVPRAAATVRIGQLEPRGGECG